MKFLCLLIICSLHAEIIHTNCIDEMIPHVDETTWVVFDIDNTLIESALHAGRPEWFYHEIKQLMQKEGVDRATADDLLYPKWLAFLEICPLQTPEPHTAKIVREIQQKCAASLALTARHPSFVQRTLQELSQIEIDFSEYAPAPVFLETMHPIHLENGVCFVSMLNSKGAVFRQFVEKSEEKPTKIVFIDDALRYLVQMEEELQKLNIPFVGFHYTRSSERPFDPETAANEYHALSGLSNLSCSP